ncbi:hypothetical protein [Shewanella septentrionalis]|uniref:Conjugal transfer protein TraL n=1 Tax=Shewanella septentrionalis TaxID=2952223 RepID=A0A9X2WZ06_9GAMM|nr:hypothetical protein [Shewanella septentrionalis]MCT7947697.1 hypothetical protein [Shewanella septentrionalis]
MKKITAPFLALALLAPAILPSTAFAVDERACSIWLCLPMGFPSGCSDAKSAFVERIKKFKPPLPDLVSCMISSPDIPTADDTQMDAKTGIAAYVPAHMECTDWDTNNDGHKYCRQEEFIPTYIAKDTSCDTDDYGKRTPIGCESTINYVQTLMNGQPYGDIYYYDRNGNAYSQ